MQKQSSHQLIKVLQAQVNQSLNLAISIWQLIPHTQFAQKPAAQSWSANECVQHLNSYGRYYLPAIGNAIEKAKKDPQNAAGFFTPGWLGNYFTKIMQPAINGQRTKKMKSPKDHFPTAIVESHLIIAEFIDQQEKLLQLLEEAGQVNLEAVRVPISISKLIKLKLGDTFNFLVAHQNRHLLQAAGALKLAGISGLVLAGKNEVPFAG